MTTTANVVMKTTQNSFEGLNDMILNMQRVMQMFAVSHRLQDSVLRLDVDVRVSIGCMLGVVV